MLCVGQSSTASNREHGYRARSTPPRQDALLRGAAETGFEGIQEDELEMIMDRERLFGGSHLCGTIGQVKLGLVQQWNKPQIRK